ncbi:3-oxo-tetronate kinase [Aquamicrobium ahrensii]|uniref:3-oxo-tetronate kinase n=1 Tax=Aquamicrobium ahrensii TaxID=469551 RepID=A0ABV2KP02_9HYPH
MLLGCIADDFTGASDLANTLARQGMSTVQFVGVPDKPALECEAGVVALKTRSIAPEEAVAQSLVALDWLLEQGCQQIFFKYCSTFDSTPQGNIGPVAEALLDALGAHSAVVCPVFPAAGRRLFMGHLFVNDRLLSESGMEKHPLNPMIDPDVRRWLRLQTKGEVGFVGYKQVRMGPEEIAAALEAEAGAGRRLIVIDAVEDDDLFAIAAALVGQKLVTGGSGLALGLPENFRRAGLLGKQSAPYTRLSGPGVALSGSCSTASQAQLAHYLKSHPGLALDPAELMAGRQTPDMAVAWIREHLDSQPMVYSTADPKQVAADQIRFGRQELAERIEGFFRMLATKLVEAGVVRIAVGGGETSGSVVAGLDAHSLLIGPEIDPGVPALAAIGTRPVRLALKSGNFGAPDFYEKALNALGDG